MSALALEDFAPHALHPAAAATEGERTTAPAPGDYETAYGAGWDDAMAQVEAEQGRLAEQLAERLLAVAESRREAAGDAVRLLVPMLHEVFDKVLPHAAQRGFLDVVAEEARAILEDAAGTVTIQVAPEEAAALARLAERGGLSEAQIVVEAEAALAPSQAMLRWGGQERRLDLPAVLAALDAAFSDFSETLPIEDSA